MRFLMFLGCVALLGCGAARTPVPQSATGDVPNDFDDSVVQQKCACAAPRPLDDTALLGERTVAEQRSALARTWTGRLTWHAQPWVEVPAAASEVRVSMIAKDAFEITCDDASRELNCRNGSFLNVQVALESGDGALAETHTVTVSFVPDAIVHERVAAPTTLTASAPAKPGQWMLSLTFDSEPHGQLYVHAEPEPGVAEEHPVATFELK